MYEAIGAYNLEKHNEIITIVDKSEYQKLMNFINREDPKAFVTITMYPACSISPRSDRRRAAAKGGPFAACSLP